MNIRNKPMSIRLVASASACFAVTISLSTSWTCGSSATMNDTSRGARRRWPRDEAEGEHPALTLRDPASHEQCLIDGAEDFSGIHQKGLAGGGEADEAARPIDELGADCMLQLLQLQ